MKSRKKCGQNLVYEHLHRSVRGVDCYHYNLNNFLNAQIENSDLQVRAQVLLGAKQQAVEETGVERDAEN